MSEKEEFPKLASSGKCSICGGKPEKGYVGAYGGIALDPSKRKHFEMMMWRFSSFTSNISALRCENCSIMIFDYGYDVRTPGSFIKNVSNAVREFP